ncbi:RsmB/NOP family class I SAM-dependent RNA methyltransferase [Paenibacillus sp. JX-17]|uniref:RsmB/NOP family class I SAM-dependent RNA methyltransferase n=1 Tax=Paenibacillus lacisoli TaxID=3064525 RepID=A0ABT9C9S5_9BACL|nr:RsmB/NOP family class I SAM-dependent RNA methyltransferase [Paenibacillus sp. JX-17]MDO7905986.1 RsmB/NOP family class I SAM-dependent RNA methyltransferase [Paenibacillus sp. JX-17]
MSTIQLPADYIKQMESMLGDQVQLFLDSYQAPRVQGLRLNPSKLTPQLMEKTSALFQLTPVPWCSTGYYYGRSTQPGKHPFHAAGLYYIQEPSAMSAVELLDPRPGETVLDLAAAPGGKSTHIAAKLAGEGLLISNEIHPGRVKILAENIERMGITNAVVTSSDPAGLSRRFPDTFDRIMLDAPCSGEGMFRKDENAAAEWSEDLVELCAARQWDILQDAYIMLKPGGTMAYSTCTFNLRENEEMMARFVEAYPAMQLLRTERIWPHQEQGEGHFVAVLSKNPEAQLHSKPRKDKKASNRNNLKKETDTAWRGFQAWAAEFMPDFAVGPGRPVLFGESLYYLPASASLTIPDTALLGLKLPRAGLHLGDWKKNRFEPAHALAMAVRTDLVAIHYDTSADGAEVQAYLRGETLTVDPSMKGWVLITVDGLPLGWAKATQGQLKNHYPKGLRQLH